MQQEAESKPVRKIAAGRVTVLLISLILIALTVYYGYQSHDYYKKFEEWQTARPMEASIDLSKPGEVTVPFHQTCSISHGEGIYLETDLPTESDEEPLESLEGLSATVVIKGDDGSVVEQINIDSEAIYRYGDQIELTGIAPFAQGDYWATIHVTSGAESLAGREQTIYAEYLLCGLEQAPAMIAGFFAFVTGFIGVISGTCILPGLLQHGVWRHETE